MGRVTLFTKKDCSFCDRTLALLHEAMPAAASAAAAAVGARLGAAAAADIGLELLEVWVDEDPARLTQCLHLTKQHTLPQIFFSATYVGGCAALEKLKENGSLHGMLVEAAMTQCDFPPEPDAAMVKVTEDAAYSTVPTIEQLLGLRAFGIVSCISLVHPGERAFASTESAVNAGIAIINIPPPVCEPGPGGAGSVPAAVGSDASRDDVRGDGASMGSPWTLPWALAVIIAPVLVFGTRGGRVPAALVLTRAAAMSGASASQVHRWGHDLGHNFSAEAGLSEVIEGALKFLAEERRKKKTGAVPSAAGRDVSVDAVRTPE